jgi:hypothetical protein
MTDLRRLTVIALASSIAGCASLREGPDQICKELARFANATPAGQVRSVELVNDWGSRFAENKSSIFTKDCSHNGYPPGVAFCDYLMSNTSTEFSSINYARVSACLWPGTRGGPYDTDIDYLSIKASSTEAIGVNPDVRVGVEFSTGSDKAAPTLKMYAEREAE